MIYNLLSYVKKYNEKPAGHCGRVMHIDARGQYEKEPKSFGNKRNRMTDAHRQWIEERYHQGWTPGFDDDHMKHFREKADTFWVKLPQRGCVDQPRVAA